MWGFCTEKSLTHSLKWLTKKAVMKKPIPAKIPGGDVVHCQNSSSAETCGLTVGYSSKDFFFASMPYPL